MSSGGPDAATIVPDFRPRLRGTAAPPRPRFRELVGPARTRPSGPTISRGTDELTVRRGAHPPDAVARHGPGATARSTVGWRPQGGWRPQVGGVLPLPGGGGPAGCGSCGRAGGPRGPGAAAAGPRPMCPRPARPRPTRPRPAPPRPTEPRPAHPRSVRSSPACSSPACSSPRSRSGRRRARPPPATGSRPTRPRSPDSSTRRRCAGRAGTAGSTSGPASEPRCAPPRPARWCSPAGWSTAGWSPSGTTTTRCPPSSRWRPRWPWVSGSAPATRWGPSRRMGRPTARAGACTGGCGWTASTSTRSAWSGVGRWCYSRSCSATTARSRTIAAVCICEIRDSVTPSTRPISARVMPSK